MSADREQAIRARADAATEGPWDVKDFGQSIEVSSPLMHVTAIDTSFDNAFDRSACEADADFIANARADVPFLLDALAQLRAERDTLREALRSIQFIAVDGQNRHADQRANLSEIEGRARAALASAPEQAPMTSVSSGGLIAGTAPKPEQAASE